ncbi:hypothetical protein BDV98DRAFT_141782 [Pterulicium gracile]|uniref:Uncharacterized protein n=1 Tax=Pterulicium gracile TaxID=1884261 RepID=A0A5C3QXU0_9AGAR|nr:hypothetical protein BDV98DRAFT_141782 [Pterula gracilis]
MQHQIRLGRCSLSFSFPDSSSTSFMLVAAILLQLHSFTSPFLPFTSMMSVCLCLAYFLASYTLFLPLTEALWFQMYGFVSMDVAS